MKSIKKIGQKALQKAIKSQISPTQFQLLSSGVKVVQEHRKKKKNNNNNSTTSSSVPARLNTTSLVVNNATNIEKYRYTAIRDPLDSRIQVRVALSDLLPSVAFGGSSYANRYVYSNDPKMMNDRMKYREYRFKKFVVHYLGGVGSTVNGTVMFGGSKDPTVALPESSEFSFLERNAKCNLFAPYSFVVPFKPEWRTIARETVDSDIEKVVYDVGLLDLFLDVFSSVANDFKNIKFDFEVEIEWRGRNPSFDLVQSSYQVATADAGGVWPSSFDLSTPIYQLSVESEYVSKRTTGWVWVSQFLNFDAPDTLTWPQVFDSTNTEVTTSRRVLLSHCSSAAEHTTCRTFVNLNGTQTLVRASNDTDRSEYSRALFCLLPGDEIRFSRVLYLSTDIRYNREISIVKADKNQALALLKKYAPNFNPSVIPII